MRRQSDPITRFVFILLVLCALAAPAEAASDIAVYRVADGLPMPNGGTFAFSDPLAPGVPDSRRFRIDNAGNTNLNLTNGGAMVSGACFSEIETPATPIAPGASSYLRVRLQCSSAGNYAATVTIRSDDPDENPYTFTLTGRVVAAPPDISVWREFDGIAVANGATYTFPDPMPAGVADSRRFRIDNNGSGNLNLTNATTLVTGNCFSQIETPASPIAPGASGYFRVRLQCSTPGTYSGTVTIGSDDPDENPYRFFVAGTVTSPGAPEIAVTRAWDGIALPSGGSFAFPDPLRAGQADSRLFQITNSGNAPLAIQNAATMVSGTCFSIAEQASATVPAGGSTTVRVRMLCTTPGAHSGALSIQSNDADENPYTIFLSGTVVANGAAFVSQSFPTSMTVNQPYDVSVTMRNSGTTTWTAARNYRLGVRPDTAASTWRFNGRVDLAATDSIAPGASKTFSFRLTAPSTPGTYTLQWQMVEELVEWFGPTTPAVTITVGGPVNGATFVSQSVPSAMVAGAKYPVSVTMRNSGTRAWSETTRHRLGSQVAGDPWGHRKLLPANVTVAPGQQYTFSFLVTAPATAGTYNFQWRMVEELVEWFGATTPNVTVAVRIGTPPIVNTVSPNTILSGSVTTVTITGSRLTSASARIGARRSGRPVPAASVTSINAAGTMMTVSVNATATGLDGFHGLVVENADGKAITDLRVVPNKPVIDSYTPSEASWGDLYFFTVTGANLTGATVVPQSASVQVVSLSGDDTFLSGVLGVDPGLGFLSTALEVRGAGGTTVLPVQLRDRSALTKTTRLAGKSTSTGSDGVFVQDPVQLITEDAKILDIEFTCRIRTERTSSNGGVLLALRLAGQKRLDPKVLENFTRGELRRIESLITVYNISRTISLDIFCLIDSEGNEQLDIHLCILIQTYIETIGLGGQHITLEACTGTSSHVEISGSGFWNFSYRWGSGTNALSECVTAVDSSPDPFYGPRQTDVTLEECCGDDVTLSGSYILGEDPAGSSRDLRLPVGQVKPAPTCMPNEDIGTIYVRAFIPWDHIQSGAFFDTCDDELRVHRGDNRGYMAAMDPERTRIWQEIGLGSNVRRTGIGISRAYAFHTVQHDGILNVPCAPNAAVCDHDTKQHDCYKLDQEQKAVITEKIIQPLAAGPGQYKFRLKGAGYDPNVPGAVDIDWDLELTLNPTTGQYNITGEHDCFPAYEIWYNTKTSTKQLYGYTPAGRLPARIAACLSGAFSYDVSCSNGSGCKVLETP